MFGDFDINSFVKTAALSIVPFMFAVTVHEVMHGYAAYKLGDDTAKNAGRLTLNPIAHIDPIGLLVLLATRMIGWAKPVPVNYYNLRHKYGVAIVSAAGPLSNLLLAFLSAFILKLIIIAGYNDMIPNVLFEPISLMVLYSIVINIALFIFNLLPIMPMDGARIIWNFMPRDMAMKYEATERYYFLIIIVLIFTNALTYIISPVRNFMLLIIDNIFNIGF
ncbi:MAG: site-2 protease family protein [Mucispirillum sp.]|nr:site-2 protease family protein [Mucispirillum sp.]